MPVCLGRRGTARRRVTLGLIYRQFALRDHGYGARASRAVPGFHVGVNNLPKVVVRQHGGRELNWRPWSRESIALTACTPGPSLHALALFAAFEANRRNVRCAISATCQT